MLKRLKGFFGKAWYHIQEHPETASGLLLVIATVLLVLVTRELVDVTSAESALAHRPHFRVRFAVLDPINGEVFREGQRLMGKIDVLNNGQFDADVTGSHLDFYWTRTGLPARWPFDEANNFACRYKRPTCKINAGGGGTRDGGTINLVGSKPLGAEASLIETGAGNWKLYILGWIGYHSPGETYPRFFDFALEYRPTTKRFWPVTDDPDYYQDPDGR